MSKKCIWNIEHTTFSPPLSQIIPALFRKKRFMLDEMAHNITKSYILTNCHSLRTTTIFENFVGIIRKKYFHFRSSSIVVCQKAVVNRTEARFGIIRYSVWFGIFRINWTEYLQDRIHSKRVLRSFFREIYSFKLF